MRWIALCAVLPLLLLSACFEMVEAEYEPRTESQAVEVGEAELIQADINMPAGTLQVVSGAEKLLDGKFTYSADELRPEVSYQETGFRGRLKVSVSGARTRMPMGNQKNHWEVKLSNGTPIDLNVKLGAGEGHFKLAGLQLRGVDVEMGAGAVELDLTGGEWGRDFDVKIRGGVGEANIRVPTNVGVLAEAEGGIGEIHVRGLRKQGDHWVNEAYGVSPITIRLDVKGGVGEINIVSVS